MTRIPTKSPGKKPPPPPPPPPWAPRAHDDQSYRPAKWDFTFRDMAPVEFFRELAYRTEFDGLTTEEAVAIVVHRFKQEAPQ